MHQYDPTTQMPLYFSRVDQATFDNIFMPDRQRVAEHFGDLFIQNHFLDTPCLSHGQIAMWFGGLAMYAMIDTSHRYWTEDDQSDNLAAWSRLVWRVVHVLPLGYAFSAFQFKRGDSPSWNPALQPIKKGLAGSSSNRVLSGSSIGLSIFMKLFPEYFEEKAQAMMAFAICDVFSATPNSDNPLYVAMRNATRSSLIAHPYPVPFFWRDALTTLLSISPNDMYKFNAHSKFKAPESYSLQAVLKEEAGAEKQDEPVVDDEPSPKEDSPVKSSNEFISPEANSKLEAEEQAPALAPVFKVETPVSQQDTKIDSGHEHTQTDKQAERLSAEQKREVVEFVANMATTFSQQYRACKFKFNQAEAVCHYIDNEVYFVIPIAFQKFLECLPLHFTPDTLQAWLVQSGVICPVKAKITNKKGKQFNVSLARIHSDYGRLFIPDNIEPINNRAFSILENSQ